MAARARRLTDLRDREQAVPPGNTGAAPGQTPAIGKGLFQGGGACPLSRQQMALLVSRKCAPGTDPARTPLPPESAGLW